MKGKVSIELERIVTVAVEQLKEVATMNGSLLEDRIQYLRGFLMGVVYVVPIDSGEHYRRTEANVLRAIRERLPEEVRKHFYPLSAEHIAEVASEA